MLNRQTWNNYNTFTGYSPSVLFENFAKIDNRNGVIYWSTSPTANNPNADMLNDWFDLGLITENELNMTIATSLVRKDAFLMHYIESRKNRSAEQRREEMFEMRAAFGPGERVVDALTGETFDL
jgi:hypothetical protein